MSAHRPQSTIPPRPPAPPKPADARASALSDRDVNRVLALCAGIAVLAGPRRTRPLSGFLYGAYLSRVQGAQYRRLEAALLDLFDQRRSVTVRVDELEARVEAIANRVERVAQVADAPGPSPSAGSGPPAVANAPAWAPTPNAPAWTPTRKR